MSAYQTFVFKSYRFDKQQKTLELQYGYDTVLDFRETYKFDFAFTEYDEVVLDRALQLLFYVAGVSYYKAFLAPQIVVEAGEIDAELAEFLSQTYQKGLGELFYVNQLDPRTPVHFPVNAARFEPLERFTTAGTLIGVGGGKDSLLSVEFLKTAGTGITTWSLNHRPQLTPLVDRIGMPHYWVERQWDPQLFALKENPAAYNGHVPISAIFACVGTVVAILSGKRDVIVSNENSANEPTLHYQGVAINHQYSKSLAFEQAYQAMLQLCFGDMVRYFSFLRPLSELRIAELFAQTGFQKYKDVFSSCNRAFVHGNHKMFWDGSCPKCAFVFLALTPFIERRELETLFHGKNLLLDEQLDETYRQLLGIAGDKPLECVGEVKESRAAMRLAQQIYPALAKYNFELPDNYDYKQLKAHSMPADFYKLLEMAIAGL
ncbi:MAG TPA: endonuclease domain-containing protein [Verrucomicrobiae bacterium]|jgi:hypothetical protein|nr:endonuclease domain-containing protein [Verrucomicrobiae bacterium]